MNIYELTDSVLERVFTCFYHGLPDLTSGEPDIFATYVTQEEVDLCASNTCLSYRYSVSVVVFTPKVDVPLYEQIKSEFKNSGFSYARGSDMPEGSFPQKKLYSMEFNINIDMED